MQALVERLRPHRERLFTASLATFGVGVILLLVSELLPLHEIRVLVAGLISLGGIGAGIDLGISEPGRERVKVPAFVKTWRGVIAITAAVLAVAPVLIVLLVALFGVVVSTDVPRSGAVLLLGLLVVAAMTALTLLLTVQSIQAIQRAAKQTPADGISAEAANAEGRGH